MRQSNYNLLVAIRSNDIDRVRDLLKDGAGADPNFQNNNWEPDPPLMVAVEYLHEDRVLNRTHLIWIIELLLEHGASKTINFQNEIGWTVLMEACYNQHICVVRSLLEHGAVEGINLQSTIGETALILAAQRHSGYYVVKMLLENGADPTIRDDENETAFDQPLFLVSVQVCNLWAIHEIYPMWYQRYDLMENNLPFLNYFHLIPRELLEMIFEWI